MTLAASLSAKPLLLLDGAMGTELHRYGAGVGLPLWSTGALLNDPELVRKVHIGYVDAGVDILTTNTFRTNLRTLRRAGLAGRWEELNQEAVRLAKDACRQADRPILLAGSMAPVEDCYAPELVPGDGELCEEHGAQAGLLAELGVDVLLLETMNTLREGRIAAEACAATGIEFAISFVTRPDGRLLSGESLQDAVRAVAESGPAACMVNCVSAAHIMTPLRMLLDACRVPCGCYANIGTPVAAGTHMHAEVTREQYVAHAHSWRAAGARIIGGCCGTTPSFIRSLHEQFPSVYAPPSRRS